jgi:hypothetical protein
MEVMRSSEMSLHTRTTRHYIPEDDNIQTFIHINITISSANRQKD